MSLPALPAYLTISCKKKIFWRTELTPRLIGNNTPKEEHKEDARDKRNLFLLVAAISVVVGIIMLAMYPDDVVIILIIILGIIAVIGLTAFLSILSPYRWNKKHLGDVYITKEGAYLNRRPHIWKGLGTKLEGRRHQIGIDQQYPGPACKAGPIAL